MVFWVSLCFGDSSDSTMCARLCILDAVEEQGQKPAEFAQAFGTRTFNGGLSGRGNALKHP